MAGYSGTPLARKLGFKEGQRVAFVNAPGGFPASLGVLPDGVKVIRNGQGSFALVVLFGRHERALRGAAGKWAERLDPAGMLWIAWPKKASRVHTDLGFDRVQGIGLASGLVDTKVCAIDETWSALRFVRRVEDRRGGRKGGCR